MDNSDFDEDTVTTIMIPSDDDCLLPGIKIFRPSTFSNPPKWYDEPCTKPQREEIESLRLEYRHRYPDLLMVCKSVTGKGVTSHGKLTKKQASDVIGYYRGLLNR